MEKGFGARQTRSSVPWGLGTGLQSQARGREASRGPGTGQAGLRARRGQEGRQISQSVPWG